MSDDQHIKVRMLCHPEPMVAAAAVPAGRCAAPNPRRGPRQRGDRCVLQGHRGERKCHLCRCACTWTAIKAWAGGQQHAAQLTHATCRGTKQLYQAHHRCTGITARQTGCLTEWRCMRCTARCISSSTPAALQHQGGCQRPDAPSCIDPGHQRQPHQECISSLRFHHQQHHNPDHTAGPYSGAASPQPAPVTFPHPAFHTHTSAT
jgi:hypothetical protein